MLMRPVLMVLSLLLWVAQAYAGDHVAVDETIWPSQNDIALTTGDGKKLLENQWAKQSSVFRPNNYSLTGLTVPSTSVNLSISISAGTAYIAGRSVSIPGATSVTAAASSTNYVFLKLTRDGASLGTGVSFQVSTSNSPPADSIYIATLTAGASTITATSDTRILPTSMTMLSSGTSWIVPAGITQIYVEVFGAGGGGGGGGGSGAGATGGSTGFVGGNTTFSAMLATGGDGGSGGAIGTSTGQTGALHGTASGAVIMRAGNGMPGGGGGGGGGSASHNGLHAGNGGYAAERFGGLVPGTELFYAIGAAGGGGAAGAGASGAGGPGRNGQAGMIVIHY